MVFHAGTTICPSAVTAGLKQWLANYNTDGPNWNVNSALKLWGNSVPSLPRDMFVQCIDGSDVLEVSGYILGMILTALFHYSETY